MILTDLYRKASKSQPVIVETKRQWHSSCAENYTSGMWVNVVDANGNWSEAHLELVLNGVGIEGDRWHVVSVEAINFIDTSQN